MITGTQRGSAAVDDERGKKELTATSEASAERVPILPLSWVRMRDIFIHPVGGIRVIETSNPRLLAPRVPNYLNCPSYLFWPAIPPNRRAFSCMLLFDGAVQAADGFGTMLSLERGS